MQDRPSSQDGENGRMVEEGCSIVVVSSPKHVAGFYQSRPRLRKYIQRISDRKLILHGVPELLYSSSSSLFSTGAHP